MLFLKNNNEFYLFRIPNKYKGPLFSIQGVRCEETKSALLLAYAHRSTLDFFFASSIPMASSANLLPFDPKHFATLAAQGERLSVAETFQRIYDSGHWGAASLSGEGATASQTATLRAALPPLFRAFNIRTLLDAPCGDFSWMQSVDLTGIAYTGLDIVPELIAQNQQRFVLPNRRFLLGNLLTDPLPEADLILCRDALVHFSFADIERFLDNLKQSPITYLLTTTFPERPTNADIITGDWRVLNLERAPFNFPPPLCLLNEDCTEGNGAFADKSLSLWRIADLT